MRRTMHGLSLPQFRTLNYLKANPEASLSDVAAFHGLTLPSASRMIQILVEQEVIVRRDAEDRRRVCLSLTQQGNAALAKARLESQRKLAENLGALTQKELDTVSTALRILNIAFLEEE